jgi:hypothetical protein
MAKKQPYSKDEHQREITKILRSVSQTHGLWQVFKDFVAMSALAISNAVDRQNYVEREAEYMAIVKRYNKEEANKIAEALAHVVEGLSAGMNDFLGSLFMSLELGNSWTGQFFTPYEISLLMAKISVSAKCNEVEEKGFITVADPAIGGGAMVIAAAEAMLNAGHNYQNCMHCTGTDIDIVAVHMAYIQCSLLHIPSVIRHGNSLTNEVWSEWKTPAHVLGCWEAKLKRASEAKSQKLKNQQQYEMVNEQAHVSPIRLSNQEDQIYTPVPDIDLRGQIALF